MAIANITRKARKTSTTGHRLRKEYIFSRYLRFMILPVPVRKLILEIILYYLNKRYLFDKRALRLCSNIIVAIRNNESKLMNRCYLRFLLLLPHWLKEGIQGRNLYKQPSEVEKEIGFYYLNDIKAIQESNRSFYQPDESGLTPKDHLLIMNVIADDIIADFEEDHEMGLKK